MKRFDLFHAQVVLVLDILFISEINKKIIKIYLKGTNDHTTVRTEINNRKILTNCACDYERDQHFSQKPSLIISFSFSIQFDCH